MENGDFSKLVDNYFLDYLFASEDFKYFQVKDGAYLNKDTIAYKKSTNQIFLLQITKIVNDLHFYLWTIDLNFATEVKKPEQSQEDFLKHLKTTYFKKIMVVFIGLQEKELAFKETSPYSELPLDFKFNCNQTILSFETENRVFLAALEKTSQNDKETVLRANELKQDHQSARIDVMKWHPEAPESLGILINNQFSIYDVTKDLDHHDFTLSLAYKKRGKTAISYTQIEPRGGDENQTFVDFTFCTQDDLEDFRYLSVFFMTTAGDIYSYGPIFVPKLRISKEKYLTNSKRDLREFSEDSRLFYEKIFFCIERNSESQDGFYVLKSVRNTPFESMCKENSRIGPIAKIDGGAEKTVKRRKDYVRFFRFPAKKGHIFATLRASGKVTFLFSLSHLEPNTRPNPAEWEEETSFKFAVIGKFQLPTFLPELTNPTQTENANFAKYKFVKNNTKMNFLQIENDKYTRVMLLYYNRVYLFHLEWADLIEKSLESKSFAQKLSKREDFRTNCELILDNSAEPFTQETSLAQFKPFGYGFYGLTLVKNQLFFVHTNGELCDYSLLRILTTSEFKHVQEEQAIDLALLDVDKDYARFKSAFQGNAENQMAFQELISRRLKVYTSKEGQKSEVNEKVLNDLEEDLDNASRIKERIENSFSLQVSALLDVKQKQRLLFEKLKTKAKELYEKREAIEKVVFKRLLESNEQLKKKINILMDKMRNVVSPLSEADAKAKEELTHLEEELKTKKAMADSLKKTCAKILEIRKENEKRNEEINGQEVFGDFLKRYADLEKELKELQSVLSGLEN